MIFPDARRKGLDFAPRALQQGMLVARNFK